MSAMFDYITGKKSGREAELEASLEHMGGYLGVEIDDNEKLRAEIERLTAENEKLRNALREIEIKGGATGYGNTALRILARRALNHA